MYTCTYLYVYVQCKLSVYKNKGQVNEDSLTFLTVGPMYCTVCGNNSTHVYTANKY